MEIMIDKVPIRFVPYFKRVIWGGQKICSYKRIDQHEPKIGESWEISAVPGQESVVADGAYRGMTITELIDRFGKQLLGEKVMRRYGGKFPILVKLIDATDNLSVQVHPDDDLAMIRHNSLGKTEMWYIIGADKDAKIYSGLRKKITSEEYIRLIEDGKFLDVVATHESAPDDVFFLPAGRVHAIGAGNLLAEIQESSDITYRIYDYDRRDAQGNTRELHTELAKDAIDYNVYDNYKETSLMPMEGDMEIVSCCHFTVNRVVVDGKMKLKFDTSSFTILMCLEGSVVLMYEMGEMCLEAGNTVLLPSVMEEINVEGKAKLLYTRS